MAERLLPFRKAVHKKNVLVDPRVSMEDHGLPIVVLKDKGEGHHVIFPPPESSTLHFDENMQCPLVLGDNDADECMDKDVNFYLDSEHDYVAMLETVGADFGEALPEGLEVLKKIGEDSVKKNPNDEI
ncbi:hypothetical protein AMTR_s00178p00038140 [Amborella trichopoda]|uniref:Uncharacterized protein n=1 Tax=Amborella trichopoda TaxID=13333 RepID=W1PR31_AMBTC|nr:hypothetical protein AMTR_s00178p00038140 [Amborella trichopoda]